MVLSKNDDHKEKCILMCSVRKHCLTLFELQNQAPETEEYHVGSRGYLNSLGVFLCSLTRFRSRPVYFTCHVIYCREYSAF